ncbi:hypothetical protein RQP46_000206 [Phenoliferia psychrophenolica]
MIVSDPQSHWGIRSWLQTLHRDIVKLISSCPADCPVGPFGPDQRIVMMVFSLPTTAITGRKIYDEVWDAATSGPTWARDEKAIGLLFTVLACSLAHELRKEQPSPERIAQKFFADGAYEFMYPRLFAQQFKDAFELSDAAFLALLPNTAELIERDLPEGGGVLRDFTDGAYPHYVLNEELIDQVLYVGRTGQATLWGFKDPAGGQDPKKQLKIIQHPHVEHYSIRVRKQAFAAGKVEDM